MISLDVERAGRAAEQDDADEQADVADAGRDERLLRRLRGAALLPVEADEQERADADQLPGDVEQEQVVGQTSMSIEATKSERTAKYQQ